MVGYFLTLGRFNHIDKPECCLLHSNKQGKRLMVGYFLTLGRFNHVDKPECC